MLRLRRAGEVVMTLDEQKLALCLLKKPDGTPLLAPQLVRRECIGPLGKCIPVLPKFIGCTMTCRACQGHGWIPTTDLWAYVQAAQSQWILKGNPGQIDYLPLCQLEEALQDWVFAENAGAPGQTAFAVVAMVLLAEMKQ